jgi:amidase
VGIKPTLGLVSRSGIIPVSHSQDTAGPMARTVADAAELLAVLSGPDPRDPATAQSRGKVAASYASVLNPAALKGVRIGVARSFFGFNGAVDRIMDEAIAAMKSAGAIIADPANIATSGKFDDAESEVLNFEFKADVNGYLAALGPSAPHKTLADLIAFNDRSADREIRFGQEQFLKAQAKGPLTSPRTRQHAKCLRLSRTGHGATLSRHRGGAIVAPNRAASPTDLINGDHFTGSSTPAAVSGYPSVTVPAGYVHGLPSASLIGGRGRRDVIGLAYAFEQATKVRRRRASSRP